MLFGGKIKVDYLNPKRLALGQLVLTANTTCTYSKTVFNVSY